MEVAGQGGKAAQEREAKKERSTGHNPKECPVCMTVYDGTVQRPRTLPCGHTVCTLCVNKLKQQGHVVCPECRVSHPVPEGGQFPICYAVEAFIRTMEETEKSPVASPPPSVVTRKGVAATTGQKEASGLSRNVRSFLQKQEASVLATITACKEVQAQLDQYQTTLKGWGVQQQQLEDRLQSLLDQSRSARELVQQEESRAATRKKELNEGEQQLQAALKALHTPAAEQEARLAVGEVFRCTFEAKEMLEESKLSFPDVNATTTVRKVREASNAALKAFQAALAAHPFVTKEEIRHELEVECTIKDRLQVILTPGLKAPLQPEDLRSPTQHVRRLLEAGRVFGVHQVEGQRRYARISLEAGQLYLHSLKKGSLPPATPTLEVTQLVQRSPPCVLFLDLSWSGSALRRVRVRLSDDTPWGRQAMLLCTGQRGPSYAGTRFFRVLDKGQPGECVYGGDYKNNDGTGGAALLDNLRDGHYRQTNKAGAVYGVMLYDYARGAQFAISTREKKQSYGYVFGEVVQGLDSVVAAAQHTPIMEVTIKDCGVLL